MRQYVVIGTGLDTFGCRNPHAERLRVFEVDYPATQQWKRQRLADTAIPIPASMTFAPVAFKRAWGFRRSRTSGHKRRTSAASASVRTACAYRAAAG